MVGDTIADDIEGARALGMRAILVDRVGLYPGFPLRIEDLLRCSAALGCARALRCSRGRLARSGRSPPCCSPRRDLHAGVVLSRTRCACGRRCGGRAAIGAAVWLQLVVFIAGSVASLGPAAADRAAHLRMPAAIRTGAAALEGAKRSSLARVDREAAA